MTTEAQAAAPQATTQSAPATTTTENNGAIASTETSQTKATPAAPVVPDKYEFKRGEGSLYTDAQLAKFSEYAKAEKLTQEQAQKLFEREDGALKAYVSDQQEQLKAKAAQWAKESQADKEIGGEAFGKNVELSKRIFAKFFDPGVAKFLNDTGYGQNKEVLRGFVKLFKAAGFAEDTLEVPRARESAGPKTTAELFYGKSGNG